MVGARSKNLHVESLLLIAGRLIESTRIVAEISSRGWPQIHHMAAAINSKLDRHRSLDGLELADQILRHCVGRHEIGVAMRD